MKGDVKVYDVDIERFKAYMKTDRDEVTKFEDFINGLLEPEITYEEYSSLIKQ